MRVMRGKTFEGKRGLWEKIEVELDSGDLLPEELAAPQQVQLQLLELRADKNLVLFLHRQGQIDLDTATSLIEELEGHRKGLLDLRPKPTLRTRSTK